MNTADEVIEYANDVELKGMDFYDIDGKHCDPNVAGRCRTVKLTFITQKSFTVTMAEYNNGLLDYNFKLRPSRDDA